jgi:hypothetical protein
MRAIANRSAHLTTLKLRMDVHSESRRRAAVRAELQMPGRDPHVVLMSPEELALPKSTADARKYRYGDPPFTMPAERVGELRDALGSRSQPHEPLWLQLEVPCGTLPLLPWERLLTIPLGVPIMRMPYFAVPSAANPGPVDIAVCASSPQAKSQIPIELVKDVLTELQAGAPGDTTIHLFVDGESYGWASSHAGPGVHVYDPAKAPPALFTMPRYVTDDEADEPEATADSRSDEIRNPWLRWMLSEIGDRGIDAVHFVAHGYLAVEHGMLALAESPVRNRETHWARFVGPRELSAFLTRCGAWIAGMTAAPMNFSAMGLRLLADQLARVRVGTVLLHEAQSPADIPAIKHIYGSLLGTFEQATPPELAQHRAVYCHPAQTGDVSTLETINSHLQQCTLAGAQSGRRQTESSATPTWMLATQRAMEHSVAELVDVAASEQVTRRQSGEVKALEFIKNTIEQHAGTFARSSNDKELP